jgi:hypothetical protein
MPEKRQSERYFTISELNKIVQQHIRYGTRLGQVEQIARKIKETQGVDALWNYHGKMTVKVNEYHGQSLLHLLNALSKIHKVITSDFNN